MRPVKAWLNWETLLRKHCCLLCFPGWLNLETFVSDAKVVSGKQKCFWLQAKNIFCFRAAKFVSATMFPSLARPWGATPKINLTYMYSCIAFSVHTTLSEKHMCGGVMSEVINECLIDVWYQLWLAFSGCRANSIAAVFGFACRTCLTAYPWRCK